MFIIISYVVMHFLQVSALATSDFPGFVVLSSRSGCAVYSVLGCIMFSNKCALCPQSMLITGRICLASAQRHNGEFEHRADSVG